MDAPPQRPRFDPDLVHRAARMYYLDEVNQAEIAAALQVSRPTVSRLLAEARRSGMVQITVHPPQQPEAGLAGRLATALGLRRAWVVPAAGADLAGLVPAVGEALSSCALRPGDVLLVSSGRTLHQLSEHRLPSLTGVEVAPTSGGVAEPEAWHQTNEIVRRWAERVGGRPHFLFAQARPSPAMRATLEADPDFRRTTGLWDRAAVALVGVGAPLVGRRSVSASVPVDDPRLRATVGDISLNFYGADGAEADFEGRADMVRIGTDQLRAVPCSIAVAVGAEKVHSVVGGARAGLFNHLVTDAATARLVVAALPPDLPDDRSPDDA
ncbi:DNA-binding transcriptional regulator [Desertihabitans brevis]|uniref:DNA-binding transcriptional regulator n=1 Tax=Desertihabitans brevis TaxID=2268447 RepID=A0A367YXQ3_9ACTN|nr:sugar-binding domain-containing protein [Desertihabitans brevis]RCK70683.1 DNA-binding transcriptional regulator [Desertihabitans brevis]